MSATQTTYWPAEHPDFQITVVNQGEHLVTFDVKVCNTAAELQPDGSYVWGQRFDGSAITEPNELEDGTGDIEPYMRTTIKWDGCSHLHFGHNDNTLIGYLHLCGASDFKKHNALMGHLYRTAFDLMGRADDAEGWDA